MTEFSTDLKTPIDRRKFDRIELTEDARALDQSGRELGKVRQAGGGGMLIISASADVAKELAIGEKRRISVVEPSTKTSHTIDVIVRYNDQNQIGCEFLTGPSARSRD